MTFKGLGEFPLYSPLTEQLLEHRGEGGGYVATSCLGDILKLCNALWMLLFREKEHNFENIEKK